MHRCGGLIPELPFTYERQSIIQIPGFPAVSGPAHCAHNLRRLLATRRQQRAYAGR